MIATNKTSKLLWLLMAAILLYISLHLRIRTTGDDLYFISMLDGRSIADIVSDRYNTWSGRISIEFILLHTIQRPIFWHIAVPICILMTCLFIAIIALGESTPKRTTTFTFITMVLFLSITRPVLSDAVFWVTGFYNYLLPISLAILTLYIIIKQDALAIIPKLVAIFSTFIFSYNEQSALFFLLCCVSILIVNKKLTLFSIIVLLSSACNFLISLKSPGNAIRTDVELWFGFPDFIYLNVFQKLSLGYDRIYLHIIDPMNFIFIALCMLSLFLIIKSKKIMFVNVISFAIILTHLFLIIFHRNLYEVNPFIYQKEIATINAWASITHFLMYFFTLSVILSIFASILENTGLNLNSTYIILALCFGALTVVALGFSPTVYRSGDRVLLIFDLTVIFAILKIVMIYFPRNPEIK